MFDKTATTFGESMLLQEQTPITSRGWPAIRDADLWFYARQLGQRELAGPVLEDLVRLYLRAASKKSNHIALIWPGGLQAIPLVHSMACFALWANGYKRGVRGLYYPAKQNTFYILNHIHVSRTGIIKLAKKICGSGSNSLIREDCPEKDVLLFTVNSLKSEFKEEVLRPSINELIPHFSVLKRDDKLEDYAEKFYARLRSKLQRRAHAKALLNTTFPELGAPGTAPDAIFALGYALEGHDIEKTLRFIKKYGPPKVVLLDGTKHATREIPDWQKRFINLVNELKETFREEAPGILMITDDPRQMSLFDRLLKKTSKDRNHSIRFATHGIVHTRIDTGLSETDVAPVIEVPSGKVTLQLTDNEIGKLIDDLVAIGKRLDGQNAKTDPVRDSVAFLSKLSHVPGSLEALWDYLNNKNLEPGVKEKFDWRYFRGCLRNFAVNDDAKDERVAIEHCIRIADKLVAAYQKATPLGLKLYSEIQRATEQGKQPVVVVRRPIHRAVLADFLGKQGYNVSERLIVLVDECDAVCREGCASPLIFADMTPDILRRVVADPAMPDEVVLTLTSPMAKELKFTVEPILRMPEFEAFHSRLKAIQEKLGEQLLQQGRTLLEDDTVGVPSFSLRGYENYDDQDVDDKDAVLVEFDDGPPCLKKSKHSVMYVYDPEDAEDGYSGFRPVHAENLEIGQQVFLMSSDLRELIEGLLSEHGFKVSPDAAFEAGLRLYHERVSKSAQARFTGNKAALGRWLQDQMLMIDPSIEKDIGNVKHWVDLGHSPDTPFEKLAPQAPRSFKAFKVFCQVLGISNAEMSFFWDFVIKPLRGTRRKTGRWLSDVYTRILFDPDSAIAYAGISRETIDMLRRKATEQVFVVNYVTTLE